MSTTRVTPQAPLPQLIPVWSDQRRLKGTKDGETVKAIQFQYLPLDMQDTGWEGEWTEIATMGQDQPVIQYSNGKEKGFKFTMKLWADDSTQDIQELYDNLKRSVVKDIGLARPPRFAFLWGNTINETVVVKSLGEPRWDSLRNDGTLRGVTLGIVLAIYDPVSYGLIDQPKPHTYYYTTKYGDTWEQIALTEYGDPMLGSLLRFDNPTLPHPGTSPGTVIPLAPYQTIADRIVEPMSRVLVRTPAGLALRSKMYQLRSQPRQSLILTS